MTALAVLPDAPPAVPAPRRPRAPRRTAKSAAPSAPLAARDPVPAESNPEPATHIPAPATRSPKTGTRNADAGTRSPEADSPLARVRAGWTAARFAEAGEADAWRATVDDLARHFARTPPSARLAVAVEQRDWIASMAMASADWRTALSALDARDKLLGLADRDAAAEDAGVRTLARLAELAAGNRNQER